jgi:cytosine/adenosine deaminase-related metal-dependent hydrolase
LANGTVTVQGDRIVAVEPAGSRTADIDLGNVALLPGFVNAHTHLDLSGLHGVVPPTSDFVGWLRAIIAHRRTTTPSTTDTHIRAGLAHALATGTTLLGDIASGGASWDILCQAPVRAVCFRELLGLHPARVAPAWHELIAWANERPDTPTCRLAVSPHAPYSVHKALIEAAARIWPVCLHLAESMAEHELLDQHAGPFVPFLQEVGVWDADSLAPSWDWLVWRCSRAPSALFAHANYLPPTTHVPANATIVYCPRTHAAFGFGPHPFRAFLAKGVRVALGTDSLASNPDLDVLHEARFIHEQHPDLPGATLLRMLTIHGAEALGFGADAGALAPGRLADMVALPLADVNPPDPHALVFREPLPARPRRTMWNGRRRTPARE